MKYLTLKAQEIPLDDPKSRYLFSTDENKQFLISRAAMERFGCKTIFGCLMWLQGMAQIQDGLDTLQVFEPRDGGEALWLIDEGDAPEGAVKAMLPSDD